MVSFRAECYNKRCAHVDVYVLCEYQLRNTCGAGSSGYEDMGAEKELTTALVAYCRNIHIFELASYGSENECIE